MWLAGPGIQRDLRTTAAASTARQTAAMASECRANGRPSTTPGPGARSRRLRPTRLAIRSIRVDGTLVPFFDGWLIRTDDPPDFELYFTTQSGALGRVASLEVTLADGRILRAQGLDAEPDPWSHRYVNGLGEPQWTEAPDEVRADG